MSLAELRRDGYLGGLVQLWQPVKGYRAGVDPVLLAASCPARAGNTVLELGCGAGAALLCLGARVPGLELIGVERAPDFASLAQRNATENDAQAQIIQADLANLPAEVKGRSFDHVIFNPPYFDRAAGRASPNPVREVALGEETPMTVWADVATKRLRPGGALTLIQRAERLPELLVALSASGVLGGLMILPVAARVGREAGRVLIHARKGARAAPRLLAPMVMHEGAEHLEDGDDYTAEVRGILRKGAPITAFHEAVAKF